jgi:hypothetical protein
MTTGRINQVTTVRNAQRRLNTKLLAPFHRCFRSAGVRTKGVQPIDIGKAVTAGLPSTQGRTSKSHHPPSNHLVPRSHKFQAHFSLSSKGQRSWPSVRTTSNRRHLKGTHSHGGSPSGYLTDRFGHRQVIHILLSMRAHITNVRSPTAIDQEGHKKPSNGLVTFPKSVHPD